MEGLLSLTWYMESPIDFEHKEYLLYAYLQKVDNHFHNKNLSPHLLHLERLTDELISFDSSFELMRKNFDKNRFVFFENVKLEGENNDFLLEIKDIVEFSLVQIRPRVELGYKILKKKNQILF